MTYSAPPAHAADPDAETSRLLTDFGTEPADIEWYVVNDDVMGGRSDGAYKVEQGELVFTGSTNTRGGGFSSLRTRPVELELSKFDGIRLQVRGDGRRYTWRLATNARWRGRPIAYWADFETEEDAWTTVDVPFSSFIPRFRGTTLDGPELDAGQISEMGLMIYDNLDGPFELRVASVHAYAEPSPFALEQYRWKNRVLVVSARDRDDNKLTELLAELAANPAPFADRDMVLVTLLETGTSTAGDRKLSSEEAAATRNALEIPANSFALRLIGKDGSVKLATESATSINEIYALIDTMPMRQREESDPQS